MTSRSFMIWPIPSSTSAKFHQTLPNPHAYTCVLTHTNPYSTERLSSLLFFTNSMIWFVSAHAAVARKTVATLIHSLKSPLQCDLFLEASSQQSIQWFYLSAHQNLLNQMSPYPFHRVASRDELLALLRALQELLQKWASQDSWKQNILLTSYNFTYDPELDPVLEKEGRQTIKSISETVDNF